MIKKLIIQICAWGLSIILGFLIVNMVCFAYERQPGWVNTPKGASRAVREPYIWAVHSSEGYSVSRPDKNGYANPDKELADHYILIMGASHTQAKQIAANKKYSVLVNEYVAEDDKLYAYNISCDGSFLPSQINHFLAATEAFPNSEMITIEIYTTDHTVEELYDALNQPHYDEDDSVILFSRMSFGQKAKNAVKKYFPLIPLIKEHMETFKEAHVPSEEYQVDIDEYSKVINKALAQIRSEYDKPIVFIYHPNVIIEKNGDISLDYSKTWEIFKTACFRNNIDVIDTGEDFLKYYHENKKVPYGFMNTTLGTGHLNADGHSIIANEIIEYWEEMKQ